MILDLELQPKTVHERPLQVVWDSEAGSFDGPDKEAVEALCRTYARDGSLVSDPYPTVYPCDDPFHNPAHLAAVLSKRWRLNEALAGYLRPPMPREGEVRVVY